MPKRKIFNKHEKEILLVLFKERRPMSIREIAEESGTSWVTARKWLRALKKKELVRKYEKKWQKVW